MIEDCEHGYAAFPGRPASGHRHWVRALFVADPTGSTHPADPGDDGQMTRPVRCVPEAAAAVVDAGLMTVFGSDAVPLPSLCEAVTGRPDVDVFVIGEDGRRHLSPELDLVWSLFTALAAERRACLGKHLRGRLVLIAPAVLADLYALTGRAGQPGDFASMPLPTAQLAIASALLDGGPRTAGELRLLAGIGSTREVKRALERLEAALVVTRAGERAQASGWAATLYDLTARRHGAWLASLPAPPSARTRLTSTVSRHAPAVTPRDLELLFGWPQPGADGPITLPLQGGVPAGQRPAARTDYPDRARRRAP